MGRLTNFFHRNHDTFWYKVMPIVNLLLVLLCIWGNSVTNAGFCRPVLWAAVVQGISFVNIITFTWLERTRLRGLNALLCGISTGVAGAYSPARVECSVVWHQHGRLHLLVPLPWRLGGIDACSVMVLATLGMAQPCQTSGKRYSPLVCSGDVALCPLSPWRGESVSCFVRCV